MPFGGTIRSGLLKHRVIIQSVSESFATASGESTDTWSTEATVSAQWQPAAARESEEMRQVAPDITHTITMRHRNMSGERRLLLKKEHTTLNGAINDSVTSVVVDASFGISTSTLYRILIGSEIMQVTAGADGLTWTATRGIDGTSAASHADEDVVTHLAVLDIQGIINIDEADKQIVIGCVEKP